MRLLASASSSISHSEARAGGEVEAPVADGALARGHGVGEQEGCGEAVGEPAVVDRLRDVCRRRRSRPARRARSTGRPGCARRSRIAARGPPTFASFTVAASHTRAAASRVLRGDDALVGRQEHVGAVTQRGHLLQRGDRLLRQLQRTHLPQALDRGVDGPAAVGIHADTCLRADRFPDRAHLRHVTVHADLQLEGLEAARGPVARLVRHRIGIARSQGRVAAHRPRRARPEQPPDRHVGQLTDQVEQRHLHGVASLRGELRHASHVVLRVSGQLLAHQLRAPQRIQLLHDQRQGRPPRSASGAASPSPSAPSARSRSRASWRSLQPAARGHVRLSEPQRERHDLERARCVRRPRSRDEEARGQQQGEERQQHPAARERAVQRGPVGARGDRAHAAGARAAPPAGRAASSGRASIAASATTIANGSVDGDHEQAPARSRPRRTASVRLPARRSVSTSRMLFTIRIAAASRPTGTDSARASQRQLLGLHVVGAGHGDDAEEGEHEQLAEPLVAVRARTARVEHARRGSRPRRSRAAPSRRARSGTRPPRPRSRTRARSPPGPCAAARGRRR